VETFVFAAEPFSTTWDGLLNAQATGDKSDILKALEGSLASRAGRQLAGVILLSDGADNAELTRNSLSVELRERLSEAGVPVHTFALGAESGFKDLAVAAVHADDFAFVRNPLEVDALIEARGFPDLQVPVTLKRDGKVVAITTAQLREGEATATVTFKFEPREVGEAVYSVEVPLQSGEALLDNNRQFFTLKIIRDRIRVLQVAGRPSWDVRFLRKLLKENPSVDLISFFILRTQTDTSAVRPDELSLIPFPTQELFTEELGTFDVVIFQNFNFGPYQMGGYLTNVRDFVIEKGGGFAMVGGELSFSEAGYDMTPLADLLPVLLPNGRGHYVEESYQPVVTEAGRRHPMLGFLGADAVATLNKLPPLEGFNHTRGLAPGAEALLTHPAPQSGPAGQPVLAVREMGRGRTLSLHTDSLWFWALPDAGQQGRGSAHRELWANAIRWLIGDPALSRIRVEARASAFDPGEDVVLAVRAFDPSYGPLANAQVELVLDGVKDGAAFAAASAITLKGATNATGEWLARIPAPGPGAYRARVTARASGLFLGADEDAFLVRRADREISNGAPRPQLLAALSHATDGSVLEEPAGLARARWQVPQSVRVHRRKTEPLWDRWEVVALFTAVWVTEWVLRRRRGYA
jgi:uncharacterized membrane protein